LRSKIAAHLVGRRTGEGIDRSLCRSANLRPSAGAGKQSGAPGPRRRETKTRWNEGRLRRLQKKL